MSQPHPMLTFKLAVENKTATQEMVQYFIDTYMTNAHNHRGVISLALRYYIDNDIMDKVIEILYLDDIMKRDYMSCINYLKDKEDTYHHIEYCYTHITEIDTKDIDMMIIKSWYELIKRFDGYPVICSMETNHIDTKMMRRYNFDVSIMREKYAERIINRADIDSLMTGVNVIIDGANISHNKKTFDFTILPKMVRQLIKLGYNPRIILHERHIVTDKFLKPYMIRTPTMKNDDDYMIYGMLQHNIMIVTNDLYRDHLKNMDVYTKCYVNSMVIRYRNEQFIVPNYTRCIQIIDNNIYIPCSHKFYKLPTIS